jgi:SEC-C motif-containing protein
MPSEACWCQSGKTKDQCCAPFLSTQSYPQTCEALMRSRYSAFVNENEAYLLKTWAASTRPSTLDFDPDCRWLGLKVKSFENGGPNDHEGTVHFLARYKVAGKAHRIDENSYFVREHGKWVYLKALMDD